MTYPGGKAGAGVYQAIINQMPPHRVYIEPFLGSGAVMNRKREARYNAGIDLDEEVIRAARERFPPSTYGDNSISHAMIFGDALQYLQSASWVQDTQTLVYCDPPYPLETRKSEAPIYKREFTDLEHQILLSIIKTLPCMVMISSYPNLMYDTHLKDWRAVDFYGPTRAMREGLTLQRLWCNFPAPTALHDYRFLGADYRAREGIRRKVKRFQAKFDAMPPLERQAIMSALTTGQDAA